MHPGFVDPDRIWIKSRFKGSVVEPDLEAKKEKITERVWNRDVKITFFQNESIRFGQFAFNKTKCFVYFYS
jgi:hypothetical protein